MISVTRITLIPAYDRRTDGRMDGRTVAIDSCACLYSPIRQRAVYEEGRLIGNFTAEL